MASRSEDKTTLYRIVSKRYPPFDGTGAFLHGSRWVDPGRYVIHVATTWSLAVLDNLVHWQNTVLPPNLVCVLVELGDQKFSDKLHPKNLANLEACRELGNQWYDSNESVAVRVPSIVSPYEDNVLINQRHVDFKDIVLYEPVEARIDTRLFTN